MRQELMYRPGTLAILLLALLAGGCASSRAVPRPFPVPSPAPARAPSPDTPVGTAGTASTRVPDTYALVGTALALRGAPYRNGGADPQGFDCSGFVTYVFGQHGVYVPRTVNEQFAWGVSIPADGILPGDLLFFDTSGGVSHVGLAIGGDEFVHAPSARGHVRVERLGSTYWRLRFIGARRIR
jgi:cell wall-associated NlpC family hydrolase